MNSRKVHVWISFSEFSGCEEIIYDVDCRAKCSWVEKGKFQIFIKTLKAHLVLFQISVSISYSTSYNRQALDIN